MVNKLNTVDQFSIWVNAHTYTFRQHKQVHTYGLLQFLAYMIQSDWSVF